MTVVALKAHAPKAVKANSVVQCEELVGTQVVQAWVEVQDFVQDRSLDDRPTFLPLILAGFPIRPNHHQQHQ
jgi:hypothetical protein